MVDVRQIVSDMFFFTEGEVTTEGHEANEEERELDLGPFEP